MIKKNNKYLSELVQKIPAWQYVSFSRIGVHGLPAIFTHQLFAFEASLV